jgi:WD40 repeat protein
VYFYVRNGDSYLLPPFCAEDSSSAHVASPLPDLSFSPNAGFWRLLNPQGASSIHMTISPPVLLSLGTTAAAPLQSVHAISSLFRNLFGFFKVFVFPVLVFDILLYLLLLYLLKDADLLQARENREERDPESESAPKIQCPARLCVIEKRHASDVRLLASASDYVLSWASFEDHLALSRLCCDDEELILIPLPTSHALIAIALEDRARFAAAATVENNLLVWNIARNRELTFSGTEGVSKGRIVALFSHPARDNDTSPPPDFAAQTTEHIAFYSAHEDGALVEWNCSSLAVKTIVPGLVNSGSKPRIFVLPRPLQDAHPPRAAVSALARLRPDDGKMEIWSLDWTGSWSLGVVLDSSSTGDDSITSVATGTYKLNSRLRQVIATGTSRGVVTIWDGDSGLQVVSLTAVYGSIRKLRLARAPRFRCFTCDGNMSDGFFIVMASSTELHIRRIFSPPTDCLPSSPARTPNLIWPISPAAPKNVSNPNRPRRRSSLMGQPSEDGSIPISCHGVRRLSEARKRADNDICTGPINGICCRSGKRAPDPLEPCPPIKEEPWGELRVQELAVFETDARGAWEVCGSKVIGVGKGKGKRTDGSPWEVWVINLAPPIYSVSAGHLPIVTGPLCLHPPLPPPAASSSRSQSSSELRRRRRDPLADFSSGSSSRDASKAVELDHSARLPFSKIQCATSALHGTALAVGLGNVIGLFDDEKNIHGSSLK